MENVPGLELALVSTANGSEIDHERAATFHKNSDPGKTYVSKAKPERLLNYAISDPDPKLSNFVNIKKCQHMSNIDLDHFN